MGSWLQRSSAYFTRGIRLRPGLAGARLVTTCIVVAAVTAVSAVAAGTVLRPLPFPAPEQLVQILLEPVDPRGPVNAIPLFPGVFDHLDLRGPAIESVAGMWVAPKAVSGANEPESVLGASVSADLFAMLGAHFAMGRPFTKEESGAGANVVVLSHGLWMRMFGSDPGVIGRAIQIDRHPFTVIGVTRADFEPLFTGTQLWTPLNVRAIRTMRASVVQTIARLREGATLQSANNDLAPVFKAAQAEFPDLLGSSLLSAFDFREARFGSRRNALLLLFAVATALGILAVANLANLTFADLGSRLADFSLRSAIGGSTRAIVVSELAPCATIAILGAVLGLAAAATTTPLMLALDPSLAVPGATVAVDWRVAAVGLFVAALVMFLAVAIPVWRIARRDQIALLAGTRLTDARGTRLRSWLVGAQTAIALLLLSAATVIVGAVAKNADIDPGFDPAQVISGQLRLNEAAFPDHQARVRFITAVLDRLRAMPNIVSAGTTLNPFTLNASFTTNVWIEDAPAPDGQPLTSQFRRVSPGYFNALRIQVLRGREFLPGDTDKTPLVAIVSKAFAERHWPNGDAIGRRIRRGTATAPWAEIVGIVADVRDAGLDRETGPVMYTSVYQGSTASTATALVVRTRDHPRSSIAQVKEAIWAVDRQQPLSNIVLLDDYLSASLGPQRFRAWLVALCSVFGIVLAIVGVYGVTSRSITERTKEVGIRIALGGDPYVVWRGLILRSLIAVVAGAIVGIFFSAALDEGLVRMLPELNEPRWTLRMASVAALLAAAALAATAAALSARTIEPVRVLRAD